MQPVGSDCSLEAQIAAWRHRLQAGGSDCSLEGQRGDLLEPKGAIWNSTGGHLQLQVTIWSFRMPFEAPGVHLELQVAIWTSRWAFGAPGGRLELQVAVWSSRVPFGVPGGSPQGQGVWRPVAACGGLRRPVAAESCPRGPGGLAACGSLWRPVATCGSRVVPLLKTFTLRI